MHTDWALLVLCTHSCEWLACCLPVLQLELRLSAVRETSELNKAVLRGEVADPDWVLQDMQRTIEVGVKHCWGCYSGEVQRVPSQRTALQGYCSPSDMGSVQFLPALAPHCASCQASVHSLLCPLAIVSLMGLGCRFCKTLPLTTA